ncbi:carboxyl transferase domain-containing protein [Hoeflea alexandrii]|uniref:carboxyl transferase domain-containing protein n=1 Tax=Hoeflea alexandrii TaxID=288436 RepID=UPI0022AF3837|nr:carboxyl transferase domain-containing protein [Hoeflea alexandrii]MCZ4291552.1 carbamoyl-phosphate synthase large subunit [Hoeflea alexandrii]
MKAVLIANRGEIAIRIARAVRELGLRTVGIHARDDDASLHVQYMDECLALPAEGAQAYLDQDAILMIARQTGCGFVHPGYGFLSENAGFARRCAAENLVFIGPSAEILELFGDKISARKLAEDLAVPVLPGINRSVTLEEVRDFSERHGAIMLKAMAGGGGRGMRAVLKSADIDSAFERCRSEALQAFGIGDLYVEKLLPKARHIEVQVIGDGTGAVCHLWERDCTIQRRHQKLVEIAPAPSFPPDLRARVIEAAVGLARHVGYASLGTFEFLCSNDEFWFMEANPRLQVEHTITEEITGIDLVQSQLKIALGATLAELDLMTPPPVSGFALQARVNLEALLADGSPIPKAGTLGSYSAPSGPNIRVDGYGYAGYRTSLRYDSLLAKVIARGHTFHNALARTQNALREFDIGGVPTNIRLLLAILDHPEVKSGRADTSFLATHLTDLLAAAEGQALLMRPLSEKPDPAAAAAAAEELAPELAEGLSGTTAPMQGTVIEILVAPGDHVHAGDGLLVLEAMKMEHVVQASSSGTVEAVTVGLGASVGENAMLCHIRPDGEAFSVGERKSRPLAVESDWREEVTEIGRRRELASAMGGKGKVARQKEQGKLTAWERIETLVDPGSFKEIGALTAFVDYDEAGKVKSLLPANFVGGTARLDGRKVMIGVDDFTVRAGSGDAAIHDKQIFIENHAREMRLPVVRLLDGASGGGSVKIAREMGFHYLPVNPAWDAVVDNLSIVPVVAACLGPTVGLGAARLVMSHLAIMVEEIGQIFTAGPPIVLSSTRENLTKEQLGGADVHRRNAMVERFVASEGEANDLIRQFLGYLPTSVYEMPPVIANHDDPCDRKEEALLGVIPRNQRKPYDLRSILDAVFDAGSVLPYAEYGGSTVTALARLDGHPVGVITTDPSKGATMTAEGAMAVTRLVDLCETFHLPIVSLTDQAGMSIGLAAERQGTIRYGARAITAIYQARVPQAEVILRRVFGVGGAGAVNRHRAQRSWSWPSGTWGSLPQQGGIEAAFRAELEKSADREAEIRRIATELERIGSPFRTAERFGVQDLIDPRETRPLLCDWVRDAYRLLPELSGRPAFGTRP